MNWNDPYLVVRPSSTELIVLNYFRTLREARYYLQYLAEPMDAIFTTDIHEQYKGTGIPTYNCHKIERGRMDFHEEAWSKQLGLNEPYKVIDTKEIRQKSKSGNKETQIVDLSTKNFDSEELQARFNINSQDLNLLFSDSENWSKWNSHLTQKSNNVYIISVKADSTSPMTLQISPNGEDKTKNYESGLAFIVKPRASF